MWSLALLCLSVTEPSVPPLVQATPEKEPTEVVATTPKSPETTAAPPEWEHPWVVLKLGLGSPGNVNASAEVLLTWNFAFELGAGAGLGANAIEAGLRWRPSATCWGCRGANLFTLGFGAMVYELTRGSGPWDVLPTVGVDGFYAHRFRRHFGLVVGTRAGIGPYLSGFGRRVSVQPELFLYGGLLF